MMDRQHGKIVWECDGCHEVLETGESDFHEALGVLRDEGWLSRQVANMVWCHYCPECRRTEE